MIIYNIITNPSSFDVFLEDARFEKVTFEISTRFSSL